MHFYAFYGPIQFKEDRSAELELKLNFIILINLKLFPDKMPLRLTQIH
jgi:hypothetical protein